MARYSRDVTDQTQWARPRNAGYAEARETAHRPVEKLRCRGDTSGQGAPLERHTGRPLTGPNWRCPMTDQANTGTPADTRRRPGNTPAPAGRLCAIAPRSGGGTQPAPGAQPRGRCTSAATDAGGAKII